MAICDKEFAKSQKPKIIVFGGKQMNIINFHTKKAALFAANKKSAFNHWARHIRKRLRERQRNIQMTEFQTIFLITVSLIILCGLLNIVTRGVTKEQVEFISVFGSFVNVMITLLNNNTPKNPYK